MARAEYGCLGGASCGPLFASATATRAFTLVRDGEHVRILDNWDMVNDRVRIQRGTSQALEAEQGDKMMMMMMIFFFTK